MTKTIARLSIASLSVVGMLSSADSAQAAPWDRASATRCVLDTLDPETGPVSIQGGAWYLASGDTYDGDGLSFDCPVTNTEAYPAASWNVAWLDVQGTSSTGGSMSLQVCQKFYDGQGGTCGGYSSQWINGAGHFWVSVDHNSSGSSGMSIGVQWNDRGNINTPGAGAYDYPYLLVGLPAHSYFSGYGVYQ